MTSLREAAAGRPIDRDTLLDAFVDRLEARTIALRDGRFDATAWVARQLTNGRPVQLDLPDGRSTVVRALGVDVATGGLVVDDSAAPDGQRTVLTGEIVHLRLAGGPIDAEAVGV
jgi:biotin-(acetyl-CoA carboxylase) ligase